jgi:hypothetical protein
MRSLRCSRSWRGFLIGIAEEMVDTGEAFEVWKGIK